VRRRAVALVLAAAALTGCATGEWVYEKPGLTPAKLDHDMVSCRKEAFDPRAITLPGVKRVDRPAFNRCMERKGYSARTAAPP